MSRFRRRKRLLIIKKFQIRYISLILAFMFYTAILTGYTVYVTAWIMFGEKLAAVYPQGLLLGIVEKVNTVLFLRLIFLTPLVILIGLVLSNRIAGPIYRIQKFIQEVSSGNYDNYLRLRKKDELQDLAGALNQLVSRLRSGRDARQKKLDILKKQADELKAAIGEGERDSGVLIKKFAVLRRNLDDFDRL